MKKLALVMPVVITFVAIGACSSSPPPPSPATPAAPAASSAAPAAVASSVPSATPAASATPPPPTTAAPSPPRRSGKAPAWTMNGTDPATGMVVVRCENAAPPDDHSGHCSCEGYDLDVCPDGVAELKISGKQCGFKCKPRAETPPTIAVACADGAKPTLTQYGCVCGKQKPIDPCVGGLAGDKLDGNTCVITCRKKQ